MKPIFLFILFLFSSESYCQYTHQLDSVIELKLAWNAKGKEYLEKHKNQFTYYSNHKLKKNERYLFDTILKSFDKQSEVLINYVNDSFIIMTSNIINIPYFSPKSSIFHCYIQKIKKNQIRLTEYEFANGIEKKFDYIDSFFNDFGKVDSVVQINLDTNGNISYRKYQIFTYENQILRSDSLIVSDEILKRERDDNGNIILVKYYNDKGHFLNETLLNDDFGNMIKIRSHFLSQKDTIEGIFYKVDHGIEFNKTLFSYTIKYYGNQFFNAPLEELTLSSTGGVWEKNNFYYSKLANASVAQNISNSIEIYPNPCQNTLNIKTDKPIQLTVYNQNASPVLMRAVGSDSVIDMYELTNGLYFYQVVDKSNQVIKSDKLLIAK